MSAQRPKCKGCKVTIPVILGPQSAGTIEYGYCSYACMQAYKPEAFGGDPNALMTPEESPEAFHKRKMSELGEFYSECEGGTWCVFHTETGGFCYATFCSPEEADGFVADREAARASRNEVRPRADLKEQVDLPGEVNDG